MARSSFFHDETAISVIHARSEAIWSHSSQGRFGDLKGSDAVNKSRSVELDASACSVFISSSGYKLPASAG